MISAPPPSNESARLAALRATNLLDSAPEAEFDDLVELASMVTGMPMALISLVDEDRQWFKARVGLDATETSREVAFCAHAILEPGATLEVPNALEDDRFHDNPLVTQAPSIRAYYGRPLIGPEGHPLGTLCTLDTAPHELRREQVRALDIIAGQVEARITLRRERDRAEAASTAKTRFLAAMSHEIRTPLHGLLGTLDLLEEDLAGSESQADVRSALGSGRQLLGLLNSVLDVAKADADQLTLHPTPTDLRLLVVELADSYSAAAGARGLTLDLDIDRAIPAIVAIDGVRLGQVLGNLIGNAVKFTDSGSILVSASYHDGGRVTFEVRDTGRGLSPEDQVRIFQRFEQGQPSDAGTGIGLSLAADLVELMGGRLTVDSALGLGSQFRFTLAVEAVGPASVGEVASEIQPMSGQVLLVDDDRVNLAIGERRLARLGLDVAVAGSGEEALAILDGGSPTLVLLDLQMPGMDGFEVCRRVRAWGGAFARIPILALTATSDLEIEDQCRAAGMDAVLPKPITRMDLAAAISRWSAQRS